MGLVAISVVTSFYITYDTSTTLKASYAIDFCNIPPFIGCKKIEPPKPPAPPAKPPSQPGVCYGNFCNKNNECAAHPERCNPGSGGGNSGGGGNTGGGSGAGGGSGSGGGNTGGGSGSGGGNSGGGGGGDAGGGSCPSGQTCTPNGSGGGVCKAGGGASSAKSNCVVTKIGDPKEPPVLPAGCKAPDGAGGAGASLGNIEPSTDDCGSAEYKKFMNMLPGDKKGKNYGDPKCEYVKSDPNGKKILDKDKLMALLKEKDAGQSKAWFCLAGPESNYNPNAFLAASTSGAGAYGLYQMNPPGKGNGQFDNGYVVWSLQVDNAIKLRQKTNKWSYWDPRSRSSCGI